MPFRRSAVGILFDSFNIVLMMLLSAAFVIPFIHVVFASVSDPVQVLQTVGIMLWPRGFTLKGYLYAFSNRGIYRGFLNTLFYVAAGTTLNVFFTATMAYILSRRGVFWKPVMMFLLVFTMFFSGGLIPFYLQVRHLGLYNSRLAMIVPGLVSVMNMIIMRTSFMDLPESLIDSAKIDGAGHVTILLRIVVPLSKAVLSVIALFYAVGHWNAWFNASIFLQDRIKYPLQLILREILIIDDLSARNDSLMEAMEMDFYRPLVKYATIVIATVPVFCVYPFIQKYFAKGVMIGSLKG
jgi:putative aldouronate transport system permease protein